VELFFLVAQLHDPFHPSVDLVERAKLSASEKSEHVEHSVIRNSYTLLFDCYSRSLLNLERLDRHGQFLALDDYTQRGVFGDGCHFANKKCVLGFLDLL
jgi:hypothetical protein